VIQVGVAGPLVCYTPLPDSHVDESAYFQCDCRERQFASHSRAVCVACANSTLSLDCGYYSSRVVQVTASVCEEWIPCSLQSNSSRNYCWCGVPCAVTGANAGIVSTTKRRLSTKESEPLLARFHNQEALVHERIGNTTVAVRFFGRRDRIHQAALGYLDQDFRVVVPYTNKEKLPFLPGKFYVAIYYRRRATGVSASISTLLVCYKPGV
jgi:hypothetical protein